MVAGAEAASASLLRVEACAAPGARPEQAFAAAAREQDAWVQDDYWAGPRADGRHYCVPVAPRDELAADERVQAEWAG